MEIGEHGKKKLMWYKTLAIHIFCNKTNTAEFLQSDNSQVLMIKHLRRIVPRPEVLFFYQKKASQTTQAYFNDMLKKAYEGVSTSTGVVSPTPCLLFQQLLQI